MNVLIITSISYTFSNTANSIINAILKFLCNVASFINNNIDLFLNTIGTGGVLGLTIRFLNKIPLMSTLGV